MRGPFFTMLTKAVLVFLAAVACSGSPDGPSHPSGVPEGAFWLGGSDGGAFVALEPAAPARRFDARIYHENGELWYAGPLVLEPEEGASVDPVDRNSFAGWDGERLLLTDGRALRPAAPMR
jgi:hypothetical protein